MLDIEHAKLATDLTARISAALLASNLIAAARRISSPGGPDSAGTQGTALRTWRAVDVNLFAAFIVSHTVHFTGVAAMAVASSGENIRVRGGWLFNIVIAVLFYAACFGILVVKRRPTARWPTVASKRLEMIPLVVFWTDFAQSYLIRFLDSWIFALLALVLLCAIVPFLRQSLRSGQADALGV